MNRKTHSYLKPSCWGRISHTSHTWILPVCL
uniref:Uncharacterized protein n=1 Tax=Anguilla anguilla TaxID=7936 RepID=A0A0E9SCH1_ANGAN